MSTKPVPAKPARPATATPPTQNNASVYWGACILAVTLFLLFALPHIGALQIGWLLPFSTAFKYALFPLFATGLSAVASVISQKVSCGSINADTLFNGLGYFAAALYGGLLLGAVSYFRAPIVSLFATDERFSGIFAYERQNPFLKGIAQGYWVLFGALIGQIVAGSMAVVC
jgi:hypothetical protein